MLNKQHIKSASIIKLGNSLFVQIGSVIMGQQIIELNCPGCGARVSTGQKECDWCHKPVIITTFNSVYSMPIAEVNKYAGAYKTTLKENPDSDEINKSVAMCYLKLKIYEKALASFERAIEDNFDDSETYFYAAVCLLNGKKAFLAQRNIIDKVIQYIDAANMIEPKGIYYYYLSYIKYDFFERKYLNTSPNYIDCLETANEYGVSEYDKNMLFDILGVSKPSVL